MKMQVLQAREADQPVVRNLSRFHTCDFTEFLPRHDCRMNVLRFSSNRRKA